MEERHKAAALLVLVALFAYWSYRIVSPFANFILLGLIIAFLVYPIYRWLVKYVRPTPAAAIMLIAVLLVIIIPSIWLTSHFVDQAGDAYQLAQSQGITLSESQIADKIEKTTGLHTHELIASGFAEARRSITSAIPSIISQTGDFAIGILLLFFVLFYALRDGHTWSKQASFWIPIKRSYKIRLQKDMEQVTKALFFGQVLTSLLIGVATGLVLALFHVSNPIFWGFVMMVFAFLPLLGAAMIYVPVGIILILGGHWVSGISVIILCTIAVLFIDYIIRPKFISSSSKIHPLTVLIGAFGGVYLMGFVGLFTGPLILNFFLTLLSFDISE